MLSEAKVTLVSSDEKKFTVPYEEIEMSLMIKDMIEGDDSMENMNDEEEDIPVIPVSEVDSETLEKVIKYCNHHWNNRAKKLDRPLKDKLENVLSEFDLEFLKLDEEMLVKLTNAANYLNIPDLLSMLAAKIAITYVNGKSAQEVIKLFNLPTKPK